MKTVLYCRVSTLDQTLDHQLTQAQAAGFGVDEVVADHGISGVHTALRDRPEGRRLFDMLRGGDTLVVRWVDRLALQLPYRKASKSMGNHDSEIVDAGSVD